VRAREKIVNRIPAITKTSFREVACDFFQVHTGVSGRHDFISIINGIYAAKTETLERNVAIDDGVLRLYEWQEQNGVAGGALLRLRTDASARIGRFDTDELRDVPLRAGEALAEYFCFSYFAEFQVLVVHRNRYAGSHQRLEYYLQRMHGHRPISFNPIMTADALRRLDRMGGITVANVKLAMPVGDQIYDTGDQSVRELTQLGKRTGAVTLSLTLSVDHSRGVLSQDVKELWQHMVQRLSPRNTEASHGPEAVLPSADAPSVEAATLHGYKERDSDELITIDLIADRMAERVRVRIAGKSASLAELQGATSLAYQNRYEELRDQFENNHGA
jgi:hypothetical protein